MNVHDLTHKEKREKLPRAELSGEDILPWLLNRQQQEEFKKYRSFREITHSENGLPACLVEFGMNYTGFIQFCCKHWHKPLWFRNIYAVNAGPGRHWNAADHIVAVLLEVRKRKFEYINSESFACFTEIHRTDAEYDKIVKRKYHLA